MKKKTSIYMASALILSLPSCTQEGPAGSGLMGDDSRISFRTYLPSVSETRAGVSTKDNLYEFQVTCFNPANADLVFGDSLAPYFPDKRFSKHADGHFLADDAVSTIWPNSRDRLHFFAYWPSAESMKEKNDTSGYRLTNGSKKNVDVVTLDYRIRNFKIAKEIADQIDFIAAYSSATQQETGSNPLPLNFSHQLARIELSAWGASERYDFEIAGVRIGNPVTEADFNFAALMPDSDASSAWLHREGNQSLVEHVFGFGESIVLLSKEKGAHSSAGDAASIMGNAGPSMVIPMAEKIDAWEGKADPNIDAESYSTDKLYLSVLLRVINRNNEVVYPYPNNCDFIPVTYLAVGADGKVIRRVYLIDGEYYTENLKSEASKYTPASSDEVRGFCWAALPITGGAKWEAGKIYNYKLNYTNGIGWQDPEDPTPGEPIIERGLVPFEVSVAEWVEAEGHDPNLEVPKR